MISEQPLSLNVNDILDMSAKRASHLHGQVLAHLQNNDAAAAIVSLQELAILRPGDPDLLPLHATVALALDKPQEAVWVLTHALRLKPQDPLLWFNMGQALMMQEDWPRAVQSFDRVLLSQPANAEAWYQRSLAWRALGQPEKADQDLQEALRLEPEGSVVLSERHFDPM